MFVWCLITIPTLMDYNLIFEFNKELVCSYSTFDQFHLGQQITHFQDNATQCSVERHHGRIFFNPHLAHFTAVDLVEYVQTSLQGAFKSRSLALNGAVHLCIIVP